MNSHANDRSDALPEHPSLGDGKIYRYAPAYRVLTYGVLVLTALGLCDVVWALLTAGWSGVSSGTLGGLAGGLAGVVTSAPELLSTLRLTEEGLRMDTPLWTETEVSFDEVRHVFIGGASVELYVGSDDQPALTFNRDVPGSDDLIEKMVAHLPASAQVDHPSGELSGRLGDRSAPA